MEPGDTVVFHSLYRREDGEIACRTADSYLGIEPNAIAGYSHRLYDREVRRSLGNLGYDRP